MNICTITAGNYFSTYGGGQIYVKNLIQSLNTRGHIITVISLSMEDIDKPITDIQKINNVTIMQLKLPQQLVEIDKVLEFQPFLLDTIKKTILDINPGIVHAHGWKYSTAKVCDELSIDCVITAHHGGIICPNGMLLNSNDAICDVDVSMKNCLKCALHYVPAGNLFAPLISRIPNKLALKIAKFLKSHKNIPYISPAFQVPLGIINKQQQIETLQNSSVHIIAPSHSIASALKRNGISDNKINVIPHGITPLSREYLASGLANRPVRFGYVGRVTFAKGLHVLIDSFKLLSEHSRYELHIYGEGTTKDEKYYTANLKKNAASLAIIWHGKIDHTQIQKAYYSFDIMVHPTICLEVFGLTLLESLSSGRPVIATRCGGPEDFISDGIDGTLVQPNNPEDLAKAMQQYIDNPELIKQISASIRPINTLNQHTVDIENFYMTIRGSKQ